jgi:hypothetical protein
VSQSESEWIEIAPSASLENKPRWAPDGSILYFTSDRDEYNCVWGQRLDRLTKRPLGEPFAVVHLHGTVRSYANLGAPKLEISVAQRRMFLHMEEIRSNIWMRDFPED